MSQTSLLIIIGYETSPQNKVGITTFYIPVSSCSSSLSSSRVKSNDLNRVLRLIVLSGCSFADENRQTIQTRNQRQPMTATSKVLLKIHMKKAIASLSLVHHMTLRREIKHVIASLRAHSVIKQTSFPNISHTSLDLIEWEGRED